METIKNQDQLNAEANVVRPTVTSIISDLEKNNQQQLPEKVQQEENLTPQNKTDFELFGDNYRMATQIAKSDIIPDNYKNKPQNVVIALGMSQKLGLDCFTVMQNLNIVRGKTSWSGSFCKTLIEKCGRFGEIDLEYIGEKGKDNYGCKVVTTRKSDGKKIEGPLVDINMAKAEKWTTNTKWVTMPELMLGYRAMSFFARVYCPEALNGVYTTEEIEDIQPVKRVVEDVL